MTCAHGVPQGAGFVAPKPIVPFRTFTRRHQKVLSKSFRVSSLQADLASGPRTTQDAGEESRWGWGEPVLVIGAGIAGLATAAALHKVRVPVRVIEREAGPRREGSAIGLWPNAFRALDALGLAQPLREAHPLFDRIELCSQDGSVLHTILIDECTGGPHEFRGVYRGGLLRALQAGVPADSIQYSSAVSSVDQDEQGVTVRLEGGEQIHTPLLIGADGVRSRVARAVGLGDTNFAGYIAYRGVAVFERGVPMRMNTVRMLWGRGVRAGLYPLSATEAYWFTTNNGGQDVVITDPEECRADALSTVSGWSDEIIDAIRSTPAERITRSRIGDRWLAPGRAYGSGRITLVGDAAHPMTPNLGQGGCVALEDAVVLARSIRDAIGAIPLGNGAGGSALAATQIEPALRDFERERSKRVLKISVRSYLMGAALQIPFAPVVAARNFAVKKLLPVKDFLDHASYDCGTL